ARQLPEAKAPRRTVSPGPELRLRTEPAQLQSRLVTPSHTKQFEGGGPPTQSAQKPRKIIRHSSFVIRHSPAIPLNVHSYYSFLDSTLSINAIIELAKRYDLP